MKNQRIKKIVMWILGVMSTTAIAAGIASLQSSAWWIHVHQPEVPEELNAFRK